MKTLAKHKSFYIYVNAKCYKRSIEASKLSIYFIKNGLCPAANPKQADLIIIFTCGAFGFAEDDSVLTVEKSLKYGSAKVIITGCLIKIDRERLEPYDALFKVPPEDLGILDTLIQAKVPYNESAAGCCFIRNVHDHYRGVPISRIKHNIGRIKYIGLNAENLKNLAADARARILSYLSPSSVFAPKTYMLEIARGCLSKCSYCAIKQASVEFHSFPEEQIIRSFKEGLKEKNKNFALIASDIGCYGIDIGTNLPNLLKKLFAVEGDYKISLEDLNALWIVRYYPELLLVLRPNHSKVSRISFPVQSGSDRILKLMNRGYEIAEVKKCILDLHKSIPEIKLGTHIIVGFPGETDEDFEKTVELVRAINFSVVSIYWYEDRPGTIASNLPSKVEKQTITQRARLLAKEVNSAGGRALLYNPIN